MLVFAPKYELIGKKDNKTGKYLNYKGFQGEEFEGLNTFTNYVKKEANFTYVKMFLIKFDYLVTNYHLFLINEIRVLLNEIIKFKFISNNQPKNIINEEEINYMDEITKEEFDELYNEYKTKTNNIIDKIKNLLNVEKVKNIPEETYQELFDYLNEVKYKNKKIINFNKINDKESAKEMDNSESLKYKDDIIYDDNKMFEDEEDSSEKTQPINPEVS